MSSEIERLRAENAALKAKLEGAFFVSRSFKKIFVEQRQVPPNVSLSLFRNSVIEEISLLYYSLCTPLLTSSLVLYLILLTLCRRRLSWRTICATSCCFFRPGRPSILLRRHENLDWHVEHGRC